MVDESSISGPRVAAAVVVGIVMLAATGGVWLALDLDNDGLSAWTELQEGTNPFAGDTDGDGLPDGWELARGLPATDPDADRDGLPDGLEIEDRLDPFSPDSDNDGILDRDERRADCDQDGFLGAADSDDDDDGIPDPGESITARCDPDRDADGVLDGYEGNPACIGRPDCDGDGLIDRLELDNGYNPLDPDSFGTGISDAVSWAFQQAGQPASPDEDGDAIPDAWEATDGLIDWGPFQPQPGRTDFLVEYIVVKGPDSGDYALDFRPAYDAVEDLFRAESDIHLQWRETVVRWPEETRPSFLESEDQEYFLDVLGEGRFSDNPYVTTVLLNPQQEQFHFSPDILGAAFLRSMLAVVDYGAHVEFEFEEEDGDGLTVAGAIYLSPTIEGRIADSDAETIQSICRSETPPECFTSGGLRPDGTLFIRDELDASLGTSIEWSWMPNWFQTAPNITTGDGRWLQLGLNRTILDVDELAATIAHELGHTVGLCHAHEPTCYQQYSPGDQAARDTSSMSYLAGAGTLHFLASEWRIVETYLGCPPEAPIQMLADGAGREAVLDEKYGTSFVYETPSRLCGEFQSVPRELEPDLDVTHFVPADGMTDAVPTSAGVAGFLVYIAAALLLTAAVTVGILVIRLPAEDIV